MKLAILFTLLVAMAAAKPADEPSSDEASEDLLQTGNNQFTAKMFNQVVSNPKNLGKSVVMSAFSVLTPLAQLSLASEGDSHDELLKAMALPDDNSVRQVFTHVNKQVRSVKGVDLRMASSIYIPIGLELDQQFQATSRDVFNSEVKNVDFTKSQETAALVNKWVEDQTNNRIKDLVDPSELNSLTRALLVNAIYFKGKWSTPFDKSLTEDRDFHVSKEKTIKVPTMHRKGDYQYGESEELDAKLLRLPYEGGEASMLIILPNAVDGLAALEEKLKDPNAVGNAMSKMYTYEVDVYLPRFKIETETDLKEVLEKIGVKHIFSERTAQLTKLLKGDDHSLYVSNAKQKAFIEVNEEGAEAAAANAFGIVATSLIIYESRTFNADHPFVFTLREGKNTLFSGVFSY